LKKNNNLNFSSIYFKKFSPIRGNFIIMGSLIQKFTVFRAR